MKRIGCTLLLILFLTNAAIAQETEKSVDTTSFVAALRRGNIAGHLRYYFMPTDNQQGLKDYYACARGAGMKFSTAWFHQFQLSCSGSAVLKIGGSSLYTPDMVTGQVSRYESGLFNIAKAPGKYRLLRMDELYLSYRNQHVLIHVGRQFIQTPFINKQDGRMNATAVEGLWTEWNMISKTRIQLGWFVGISPRSTDHWFSPGNGIGIYPSGINPDGTKSQYGKNINSNSVLLANISRSVGKYTTVRL